MPSETVWPDELFHDLDRNGPVPLYFQVSSRLEGAIRNGSIPAGARLENEIAIGERLGLSRPTVRRAIQELVDKGMLVRRRGIGTQVVQNTVSRPVELTSLYEDLRGTQHEPSTEVLLHAVETATDEIAAKLRVPPGSEILHMRRLRGSDGTPVAILENYLPSEFTDITETQLAENGLYQLLRARGVAIRIANQSIGARQANAEEAKLLGISRGGPLLAMERVAFDDSGTVIEFGHHCYRPDLYRFETTLVAK
ncbi:MAG: GntR family transcriptional regulator [Actinobacteria bacterium]|nr:GntR family transcriptional regulator [Actinomycetota bacterium]